MLLKPGEIHVILISALEDTHVFQPYSQSGMHLGKVYRSFGGV